MAAFGSCLPWSTLGNAGGGTVFVALPKYGHGIRATEEPGDDAI